MKNYTKEEFLKEQSPLARLFISAKTNNHLSHAYLINGDYSSPLKESAIFLAKSLNCKESALACSSCNNCKKFDEGIHPDFIYIDGTLEDGDVGARHGNQHLLDQSWTFAFGTMNTIYL